MNKISMFFKKIAGNLKTTIVRFPVVLIFLAFISVNVSILIEGNIELQEQFITRMIFAAIIGAFLGTAAQFLSERFEHISKYQLILRASTFILAIIYFFLLTTDDRYSQAMFIRLFVCSFALFATYLFLPSAKDDVNFGNVALIHFKSAFTAILYGVVLYLGLTAIYFAIDLLLYKLDDNIMRHVANIVFIFFTPVYYLSLLPKFNSADEDDIKRKDDVSAYPRVLEILVSYIVIPLITVFSAVLIIYFIKILVTGIWPVGQVGPMVLGYSATGLFFYILSSKLSNKFTLLYRRIFPFVLVPLVIMQLVSSYIRIDAYGVTESRYYVVLFGIFSIVCSLYLILSKKKNPNTIVILAACFAVVSIIPPVDAFNISRNSQTARIEEILIRNNMLAENKIVQKDNIPDEDKYELTNITNYMSRMGYLRTLSWMPEKYYEEDAYYSGFKNIYGFSPYYDITYPGEEPIYVYAMLDTNSPIDISGFETLFKINVYNDTNTKEQQVGTFTLENKDYTIKQKSGENGELMLTVTDEANNNLIEIQAKKLFDKITAKPSEPKAMLAPDDLTINAENEKIRIKIIFENINIERPTNEKTWMNGSAYILVDMK